jgi:hypothetical protein
MVKMKNEKKKVPVCITSQEQRQLEKGIKRKKFKNPKRKRENKTPCPLVQWDIWRTNKI